MLFKRRNKKRYEELDIATENAVELVESFVEKYKEDVFR
jgi:hypothetical protein